MHTLAACKRLYVDHYISHVASLVSPGVDEIRWLRPVRAGDRLRIRVTVAEARASRSKPDRGLVRSAVEARNQDEDVGLGVRSSPVSSQPECNPPRSAPGSSRQLRAPLVP